MKKIGIIISITLSIFMLMIYPNLVMGIGTAALETSSFTEDLTNDLNNEPETVTTPENPIIEDNQDQTGRNRPVINENSSANQVNSRPQSALSTENAPGPGSITNDPANALTDNITINSLPETPALEKPDTLSKILNWWSVNPLAMKFWYLFLVLSAGLFLYRQTSFRKPLLFISLVIFGFYFGNTVNPINSIFSLPFQTGSKLIDSIIILALPIAISLFVGRFFCGWVCPVGAVQEFIHPEKFAFQLSPLFNRIIAPLRYMLLIGGIIFSWSALENVWNNNDPFQGLFTFKWSIITVILLLVVLAASMLIERFYCRYLCPLGAILAITSRFSLLKLKTDSELCIACGKCSQPKACPMEVISTANPYTDLPHIKSSDCIVCYRCADICRYSALKLSINKRRKQSKNKSSEQTQSF